LQPSKKFNYNNKIFIFLFICIHIKHLQIKKMRSVLSNQQLINEINSIKDDFIQSRPHMQMSVFKSTRKGDGRTNKLDHAISRPIFKNDRGGGSPGFQKHPLGYQPPGGSTATTDPLFSGVVNRPVPKGGAMLKAPLPLTGEDSESDDDDGAGYLNGYSSSDDEDDYDDGAGLVDDIKEKYHKTKEYVKGKIPTKAQIQKVSNDVYKLITSKEAAMLGAAGLQVAVGALIASRLGPYGAPLTAAVNSQINKVVAKHIKNPSEAQMKSSIRARPINRQLSTTMEESEEEEALMPRGGKMKPKGKKKPAPIVGKKRGEKVRGAVVAEIMRKKGLSLGAASKYVKDHNLY
jgi:hypothetical protein